MDRVSCPDTEIRLLPVLGVPVDRVSCPDTEIQDLSDFGLPVDRGSCPDAEIQVLPDFRLPVDRVSCPARNTIRHRKKLSIPQKVSCGFLCATSFEVC